MRTRGHPIGVGLLALAACGAPVTDPTPAAPPPVAEPTVYAPAPRPVPTADSRAPFTPEFATPSFEVTPPDREPMLPPLRGCTAPDTLGPDPLVIAETLKLDHPDLFPTHMLALAREPGGDALYMIGSGGLFVLRPSRPGESRGYRVQGVLLDLWLGAGGDEVRQSHPNEIEALGGGLLAITNRDFGLSIVDVSNPAAPFVEKSIPLPGASGLAVDGTRLVAVTHLGELVVYDMRLPRAPTELGRVTAFQNAWEVVVRGARAYVADNTLGLAVVDLSDPARPTRLETIQTAGGAQDVDRDGDHLYVAVGAAGIEIFDIAESDRPVSIGRIEYGTAVVALDAQDGLVWGVTHADVVVADVSRPGQPRTIARETTQEFAMGVLADGGQALVADWGQLVRVTLDRAAVAPDAESDRVEILLDETPDPRGQPRTEVVRLANRGSAPLTVYGLDVPDRRFLYDLDDRVVPPGGVTRITLRFFSDGNEVDTALCVATDDPDAPLVQVGLRESPAAGTAAGEIAPDFELPLASDDSVRYRLSAQLGKPVVLVYFALW